MPHVLAFGIDADGVATMITRFVPGETIARKILRDAEYGAAREGPCRKNALWERSFLPPGGAEGSLSETGVQLGHDSVAHLSR